MAKRYQWRRVKLHFAYEIREAAKLLGCSIATIRNWAKEGLPIMMDQKPFLIEGADLRAFAREKSENLKWPKPKTNTPTNYFACFHCKAYQKPALLMVDYVPSGPKKAGWRGCAKPAKRPS